MKINNALDQCFLRDLLSADALAVYDCDPDKPVYTLNEQCEIIQIDSYRHLPIPLIDIDPKKLPGLALEIVYRVACNRLLQHSSEVDIGQDGITLSSGFVPKPLLLDSIIVLESPEYVGRLPYRDGKCNLFLYNFSMIQFDLAQIRTPTLH
jgi:hypothetical protein